MSSELLPDQKFQPSPEVVRLSAENNISPIPVLIIPGFANDAAAYNLPMQALNEAGFDVLCPDYKYGASLNVDRHKQQAIEDIVYKYGYRGNNFPEVNILAHSNGGRNAIDFALNHPLIVRNLILVAPGGLRNKNKGFKNSVRDYKKGELYDSRDKARLAEDYPCLEDMINSNEEYKKWYKTKRPLHYAVEAAVMMHSAVQDALPKIKRNGTKIGIISPLQDSMFPLEEYADYMTTEYIDEFLPTQGIHGEIKFRTSIAEDAIKMLKRFEGLV